MDDQFNHWVALWDKAQASMPKPKAVKKSQTSFFGMHSVADDIIDDIDSDDIDDWQEVDFKLKAIAGEPLLVEDEGLGSILATKLGDENQFVAPNPIHFASVGMDQKMRVTPNWTDGELLINLAKVKSEMYDLECKMLTAEAMGAKDLSKLEKSLAAIQKKFDELSQQIVPNPKNDVS